jgi:uncharacterized membrane-anchored protein YitT (DUF2179 family)
MNPHFQQLIAQTVVRKKKKDQDSPDKPSNYREAKSRYLFRKAFLLKMQDALLISIGILSAGFGLKSFLLPNDFIDGGATGISLLLTEITGLPIYVLILVVNIPFIFFGYHQIGKSFTIKTVITISLLALCLLIVEYPIVTKDKLLVAVFGGFFLGAGIGLTVRGGAVLDGTEVLAIFLSKKINVTIGDIISVINIIIFSTAAYFFNH